jgi:DNA polymerase sigma
MSSSAKFLLISDSDDDDHDSDCQLVDKSPEVYAVNHQEEDQEEQEEQEEQEQEQKDDEKEDEEDEKVSTLFSAKSEKGETLFDVCDLQQDMDLYMLGSVGDALGRYEPRRVIVEKRLQWNSRLRWSGTQTLLAERSRKRRGRNMNDMSDDEFVWQERLVDGAAPWLGRVPARDDGSADVSLHDELLEFGQFVRASDRERKGVGMLLRALDRVVKALWPRSSLLVFGSMSLGLDLPTSDIDVVVSGADVPHSESHAVRALTKELRRVKFAASIQPIAKARVPIVKLVSKFLRWPMDVSFQHGGEAHTAQVNAYLRTYAALHPMAVFIKYTLYQRRLNEPFHGGLGSFGLILMVVSFLQNYVNYRHASRSPGAAASCVLVADEAFDVNDMDLGTLLVDFFDLYGNQFNYYTCGISVLGNGQYVAKPNDPSSRLQPDQLYCVDPHSRSNDVCRATYAMHEIRRFFSLCHRLLVADVPALIVWRDCGHLDLNTPMAQAELDARASDNRNARPEPVYSLLQRIVMFDPDLHARRTQRVSQLRRSLSDASFRHSLSKPILDVIKQQMAAQSSNASNGQEQPQQQRRRRRRRKEEPRKPSRKRRKKKLDKVEQYERDQAEKKNNKRKRRRKV